MTNYLNRFENHIVLKNVNFNEQYGEKAKSNLFWDVIKCNKIANIHYESIINSLCLVCNTFNVQGLSCDKVHVLINNNILKMNIDILTAIRQNYLEECMSFIIRNVCEYVKIMNEDIFLSEELLKLLDEKIDDKLKIQLLHFEKNKISIKNKNYSTTVQEYILEKLYCADDIEYLIKWYPDDKNHIKDLIYSITMSSLQDIIDAKLVMSTALLERLMQSGSISLNDKKTLLAEQIMVGLPESNFKNDLQLLKLKEFQSLMSGKRPKIQATVSNETLLSALKNKEWISSYSEDEDNKEYFKTFGRMTRKKKETLVQ